MTWNIFHAGSIGFLSRTVFALGVMGMTGGLMVAGESPGGPAAKGTASQPLLSVPGRFKILGAGGVRARETPPLGPRAGITRAQWTFAQPALLPPALDELKRASVKEGRMQIGLARPFDSPLVVNRSTVSSNDWVTLPDGWRIWSVEVSSAGALGVRLHLTSLTLPTGVQLVVYDPANPSAHSAGITAETLGRSREYWSETLLSERVVVECQVPPSVESKSVSFNLSGLSHIFQLPQAPAPEFKEGTCHNDVSCYPAYATEASAVARMGFVDQGNSYMCSGCLLADSSASGAADYFLTANHCIKNQTVASTTEFWWFYQTSSCNGPAPTLASVPHTAGGGDYLAGDAQSDFTFLRLRRAAPTGAYHLGWTLSSPSSGANLACIHHPGGSYKRISFCNQTGTDGRFWAVRYSDGVTEGGSSGAPLLDASHLVVGQLSGGLSSCSTPNGIDTFGRFDVTFRTIQKFLGGGFSGTNTAVFVKGAYNGLFFDPTNGVSPVSAGSITLTTTDKGKFSGKLQLGASKYPMRGQFDSTGAAQVNVSSRNSLPLALDLQLDPEDPDHLTGSVAGGSWISVLDADRAVFGAKSTTAPEAGQYTVVLPGKSPGSASPGGDSFGALNVSTAGKLKFSGTLADGTKLSQGSALSKEGQWPLYVPLYRGEGLLFSWVSFGSEANLDLTGDVSWIKPFTTGTKAYPFGFTNTTSVVGSSYVRSAKGTAVLNFDNASVTFLGGPLSQSFTNFIGLDVKGRVVNQGENKLTIKFSTGNGLFSGKVQDPNTGQIYPFNGVVLQKSNNGSGFFLSAGESGKVLVGE